MCALCTKYIDFIELDAAKILRNRDYTNALLKYLVKTMTRIMMTAIYLQHLQLNDTFAAYDEDHDDETHDDEEHDND